MTGFAGGGDLRRRATGESTGSHHVYVFDIVSSTALYELDPHLTLTEEAVRQLI